MIPEHFRTVEVRNEGNVPLDVAVRCMAEARSAIQHRRASVLVLL